MSEATFTLDRSSPQEWNIGNDNHSFKHLQKVSEPGKNATKGDGADGGRCANSVPKRKMVTVLKNCCTQSHFHLDGKTKEIN